VVVGVISFDIIIQGAHSLKEKRGCVRSLVQRMMNRFHVSVAEVGCQELWNRSKIGVTFVGNDRKIVDSLAERITEFVYTAKDVEIIEREYEVLRY